MTPDERDRLEVLTQGYIVGYDHRADVRAALAEIDSLKAQLEEARELLRHSREFLPLLTDLEDPDDLEFFVGLNDRIERALAEKGKP